MNEEQQDFIEKLLLIEREATTLTEDLAPGMPRTRAAHIATVARLLKARVDLFGPAIVPRKQNHEG